MLVVIEIGEGYQPLPVGITGTRATDSMVRWNIYFRRLCERIGDTRASLFVYSPVTGKVRKQKLKIEILHDIINKHQTGLFINVIPNETVIEDIRPFSGYIDCIDYLAH